MGVARNACFLAALLLSGAFGFHVAAAESQQRTLGGKRLGLNEQVLAGGRRALLNTGSRERFLQQSYIEAVGALHQERQAKDKIIGRRMTQLRPPPIVDPVQTCGLGPLLIQAQVEGVPPQDIASIFLEFEAYNSAGTPSGSVLPPGLTGGGGSPQEQICFTARMQLQFLILQYQQRQNTAG